MSKRYFDAIFIALAILMAFLVCVFASCSVHKSTASSDTNVLREYEDSIRILKTENDRLFSENLELQYLGISFDTIRVPGDTVRNTIVIHDGHIEATGRIKDAKVSTSIYTSLLLSKDRTIDSLTKVKSKEVIRVVTKDREVKKTFIPFWVWLVIIGLVIFNFRNQIKNIWKTLR